MSKLYKKVEQFINNSFIKAGREDSIKHFERTVYWIEQLKPNADEALLISGIAHDIERAFHGDWVKGSIEQGVLRKHQELSAKEITKFLEKEKIKKDVIERVAMLISHHEEGGNEDQNILKDADCVSYFENQALRHVKTWQQKGKNKEQIKNKFDYTFNKITSKKAESIAQPMYEQALRSLE